MLRPARTPVIRLPIRLRPSEDLSVGCPTQGVDASVSVRLTDIAVMMKDLQNPPHGLVSYDLLLGFEVGPSDLHPV